MRRGTTPTIRFQLPFSYDLVAELWLTVSQRSQEVFTRTMAQMTHEGETVSTVLSQEDTLALDAECPVEIQVRGRTTAGQAFASKIKRIPVEAILKDGVI